MKSEDHLRQVRKKAEEKLNAQLGYKTISQALKCYEKLCNAWLESRKRVTYLQTLQGDCWLSKLTCQTRRALIREAAKISVVILMELQHYFSM